MGCISAYQPINSEASRDWRNPCGFEQRVVDDRVADVLVNAGLLALSVSEATANGVAATRGGRGPGARENLLCEFRDSADVIHSFLFVTDCAPAGGLFRQPRGRGRRVRNPDYERKGMVLITRRRVTESSRGRRRRRRRSHSQQPLNDGEPVL